MTDYCFSTNAGAIGGIPGGRCRSNEIAYRSRLIEHGNLHGLSCHEAFIIDDRKDPASGYELHVKGTENYDLAAAAAEMQSLNGP